MNNYDSFLMGVIWTTVLFIAPQETLIATVSGLLVGFIVSKWMRFGK